MDKANSQPTAFTAAKSRRGLLWVLAAIGLVLIAAFVYSLALQKGPYEYKYESLAAYKLAGRLDNTGVEVLKPAEFKKIGPPNPITAISTKADFAHVLKNSDQVPKVVGGMTLVSFDSINPAANYTKYFKDAKKGPTDIFSSNINAFVNDELGYLFGPNFTAPTPKAKVLAAVPLATSNLKSGTGWQMDLSATISQQNSQDKTFNNVKGKLIMAFGQKNYYYFLIVTTEENWKSNQAFWQKVINSIKIDQS
jgi:hypothetical protein